MDMFVERLIESFGFTDVENWKKQPSEVVPDEQIMQQLQAGNLVPMGQTVQEMGQPVWFLISLNHLRREFDEGLFRNDIHHIWQL